MEGRFQIEVDTRFRGQVMGSPVPSIMTSKGRAMDCRCRLSRVNQYLNLHQPNPWRKS